MSPLTLPFWTESLRQPSSSSDKGKDHQQQLLDSNGSNGGSSNENSVIFGHSPTSSVKRMRLLPPPSERLMVYVRQDGDDAFTPLHLVPPTREGLLSAVRAQN